MTARARRTTHDLLLRTAAAGSAVLLLASLAACSGDDDAGETTPPALAAAVLAHYDGDLAAAAPLARRDDLRAGDVGVELAFDEPVGDHTHVRVVVTEGEPFDADPGEVDEVCDGPWQCTDITTGSVDEATLMYENGAPESDPGIVYAWSVTGDQTVWATAYGPFIDSEKDGGPSTEVLALGEALSAVVTDPGVGFTTTSSYFEAGREICEGRRWLRWYGDDNGTPEPAGLVEYC